MAASSFYDDILNVAELLTVQYQNAQILEVRLNDEMAK